MSMSHCAEPAQPRARANGPHFGRNGIALWKGDCLTVLPRIADATVDAVITDPPCCSGATSLAAKSADPIKKYCNDHTGGGRPSFEGDARDQRSFVAWGALWVSQFRRVLKPGGYCLIFTDWRQLPTMADTLQAGGITWRGVIAWDKGGASRSPHKGYFRHQCEYLVWGTRGPCHNRADAGPFPGCYHIPVDRRDKHHITGKPVALMERLVEIVPAGGLILDAFVGSGTTGVACAKTGRRAILVEESAAYCEITQKRLEQVG